MQNPIKEFTAQQLKWRGVTDLTCTLDDWHCATMRAATIPGVRGNSRNAVLTQYEGRVNIFLDYWVCMDGLTCQPRSTEWNVLQLTPHVELVEDDCLPSILHQYKDLLEGKPTGRTDVVEHQIKTTTKHRSAAASENSQRSNRKSLKKK